MKHPKSPPRGFFHFGNPFKVSSPKSSDISPRLLSILNVFEVTLAESIEKLVPKDKSDILTLSWMKQAIESLCESHKSIKTLIVDLELPVLDWDDKWIDVYLDTSVKLLDLCNAFSSELTRLNQGHLWLQFAKHNLENNSPEQNKKARSSLDSWRQHIQSQNRRIENCRAILGSLVDSLNLPKVKGSAKGKVLMRALYGVKVKTLYICSVFAAAFSGSSKDLLYLAVADELPWAKAFTDMQNTLHGEIKSILLMDGFTVLKELDAVDVSVKKLYPEIEEGTNLNVSESFKRSVSDMGMKAEKLSHGLDDLSKEVDCFFKIVMASRDALLGNLMSSAGSSPKKVVPKNSKGQLVM